MYGVKKMKVEYAEPLKKLFNLMEKTKVTELRKFSFEALNFDYISKIGNPNITIKYSSSPSTITEKENCHTYRSHIKIKNNSENSVTVEYGTTFDANKIQVMTLDINENSCKLVSKIGKFNKQEYTFKFNDKKIYDIVEKTNEKSL